MVDPIVQAQQQAFITGIRHDDFWDLTIWELSQWIKAKEKELNQTAKLLNLVTTANAWKTGYYMRVDYFPKDLSAELDKASGIDTSLNPEQSVNQMNLYLQSVNTTSKQAGSS